MHIIKISPMSFKIILSKKDLQRHGVNNMLEHADISGDFFAEIIEETNRLYGNPFDEGPLDADFFESKDGGGELFISKRKTQKNTVYCLESEKIDNLISLCKRIYTYNKNDSRLYYFNGKYSLLIYLREKDHALYSILSEYGQVSEVGKFHTWTLDEHGDLLIKDDAVGKTAVVFD